MKFPHRLGIFEEIRCKFLNEERVSLPGFFLKHVKIPLYFLQCRVGTSKGNSARQFLFTFLYKKKKDDLIICCHVNSTMVKGTRLGK